MRDLVLVLMLVSCGTPFPYQVFRESFPPVRGTVPTCLLGRQAVTVEFAIAPELYSVILIHDCWWPRQEAGGGLRVALLGGFCWMTMPFVKRDVHEDGHIGRDRLRLPNHGSRCAGFTKEQPCCCWNPTLSPVDWLKLT